MHQPCYKDLVSGEYRLPWTRMHALKDYYGMVQILDEFPHMRQTFNLVPSLLMQVEEYAAGQAADPFLRCALKPAEELSEEEVRFILQYFFQATRQLISRFPRYLQLREAWRTADGNYRHARNIFNAEAIRDLQVLSQLAWFDEEVLAGDPEVAELVAKGRDYTPQDQQLMGRKQQEILARVIPAYRELARRGQIEISATPYYHPILPLICDSDIARVSNPHAPLPRRFRFPQDAKLQLERARIYVEQKIGVRPVGLWPSEGSVSDEALALAAEAGYRWAATDNGVLARTLGAPASPDATYRHYVWKKGRHRMSMIFRDHYLSDLVGFVYSRMAPADAAADFLHRIRDNCAPMLSAGRDVLVPVILDGENAWEHYERNGRPFLRELYRRIGAEPNMEALTVSEALQRVPDQTLDHIFPGSWIGANFDVWIGFEEDNKAWELLLDARQTYDAALDSDVPPEDRNLALEELLIAEGSDWCWWYGPHHHSENRIEFDQLYRDHLANVYRALKRTPPPELSRPILRAAVQATHQAPMYAIHPVIDGQVTSYFEWMGAGHYQLDPRGSSMHNNRHVVRELLYGANEERLYLRLDFLDAEDADRCPVEVLAILNGRRIRIKLSRSGVELLESEVKGVLVAYSRCLELSAPFAELHAGPGEPVRVQLSVWQDGLPLDALPLEGFIEIREFLWAEDHW